MQAASGPVLKAQHRRVKNALAHVLLAGVHQADKLHVAVEAQESAGQKQVRTHTYSGIQGHHNQSLLHSSPPPLPSRTLHLLRTHSTPSPECYPTPLSCAFDVLLWEAHTR